MASPPPKELVSFGLGPGALRFVLAFIVVLFHGTRWVTIGHTAVYVFFVLSGFWMSRMYEEGYARRDKPLVTYAISRAWRIYPLYLTVIAFTLATWWVAERLMNGERNDHWGERTAGGVLRNALLFGLDDYRRFIVVPAWSLDYELRFYVLVPALVALRRRLGDRALWGVLAIGIGAFAWRAVTDTRVLGADYLVFFTTGMLLHHEANQPRCSKHLVLTTTAIAGLLFVAPYAAVQTPLGYALFDDHRAEGWMALSLWEAHNVMLALLLIPLVDHNVRGASSARDRALGGISYALYLVHWSLAAVYLSYALNLPTPSSLAWLAAYISASCVLGLAAHRLIDVPCEAARHRWLKGRG